MMELMVDTVSKIIQFGLMIFLIGASFVACVMVRSTYSDCDPVRVLDVYDGKFPA